MRTGGRWATLALVAALAAGPAAQARPAGSGPVVSPSQKVAGRTLAGWLQAWWQWRLPLTNHSGAPLQCMTLHQRGPVWFFAVPQSRRRGPITCTIPAGVFFLLPQVILDCSTVERPPFHASTPLGLRACARRDWLAIAPRLTVTLDSRSISPGYVVATGAFRFHMPRRDNWLGVPGKSHGLAAARGPVLLLRPLATGLHVLRVAVRWPNGQAYRWTVALTVG